MSRMRVDLKCDGSASTVSECLRMEGVARCDELLGQKCAFDTACAPEEVGIGGVGAGLEPGEGLRDEPIGHPNLRDDQRGIDSGDNRTGETAELRRDLIVLGDPRVQLMEEKAVVVLLDDAEAGLVATGPGEVDAGEDDHPGSIVARSRSEWQDHGMSEQADGPPDLLPALRDRRALRAFDGRPVPDDVQDVLWESVIVAPSHGNTQPWRILVAGSDESRAGLERSLSDGNKSWALRAPLLVAIAANPDHARARKYGSERALWAYDSGIATGNLMAQATALGLIAHPMTAFDEQTVREAFTAPEEIRVLCVIAIGYPGPPDQLPEDLQEKERAPQSRMPRKHVVAQDRWTAENSVSARDLRDR